MHSCYWLALTRIQIWDFWYWFFPLLLSFSQSQTRTYSSYSLAESLSLSLFLWMPTECYEVMLVAGRRDWEEKRPEGNSHFIQFFFFSLTPSRPARFARTANTEIKQKTPVEYLWTSYFHIQFSKGSNWAIAAEATQGWQGWVAELGWAGWAIWQSGEWN